MLRAIVIGFDGSDRALDALALARALASEATELVVCCVHPVEAFGEVVPERDLEAQALERLAAARARLGERPGTRLIARGAHSPAAGLHAEAERSGAELLVVGASHRSGLGRVVPGSVTRQVLRAAPCAVAVASAGLGIREPVPPREIGVAFDGEPEARRALDAAAALAADHGARLHVVSVVDTLVVADAWTGAWAHQEIHDELRRDAERRGREALAALPPSIEASLDVRDGAAAQELVLASSRLDLLVLGSRGYGPLRRALLGTVSGEVADAAACPVLVVPRGAPALGARLRPGGAPGLGP